MSVAPDHVTPRRHLVALDIDGTLLSHDGVMSDEARAAVRDVRSAGHEVVLATGRALVAVLPILSELGIHDGWAVCSNGAVTARLDPRITTGYEVIRQITFDPGPALRTVRAEMPEVHLAVENTGLGSLVSQPFPPGELGGEQIVVGFERLCEQPATRVVVRSPAHSSEHFAALAHRLGLDDVSYYIGWTAWMDIVPPGVTKASALQYLCDDLGFDVADVVAVGDGTNDIDMLRWAGRGIAMGHAPESLRMVADEVTAPIDDDGVVVVLRSLPGLTATVATRFPVEG